MTRIRPDAIVFSNLTEAFLNYDRIVRPIDITATVVPNGSNTLFQADLPYSRTGTIANLYLQRPDTGLKVPANAGKRLATSLPNYTVYQYKSTEIVEIYIAYSSTTISIGLNIINTTGSSIILNAQTINAIAIQYDAPITPIP
jgi:hypothetical protein